MAWIESHQALKDHPKTKRLARSLGVDRAAAIGWIHMLWWWALDYAEDGDLARFDDDDIEDGVDWSGDAGAFVGALRAAGFIDDDKRIHDWYEYAGRLQDKRAANAERMRKARAMHKPITNVRSADNVHATCDERAGATGPNQTVPDRTGPDDAAIAATRDDGDVTEPASENSQNRPREAPWTFSIAALTEPARGFLESYRVAYGAKRPPKLNRTQVAQLEEAVSDLGNERLEESAVWAASSGVEYGGAGVIKSIRAARTKRKKDEDHEFSQERTPRNGTDHGPMKQRAPTHAPISDEAREYVRSLGSGAPS